MMNNKTNKKEIDFSLVLALYNEGPTLPSSLVKIFALLDNTRFNYEIILIDDCSEDQTANLAKKAIKGRRNCRFYQHEKNLGRGGTVTQGMELANGKVVGFVDVDLEVGPDYMPGMVDKILNGEADVVTGRRVYKLKSSSLSRHISSQIYHWLVKLLLNLPFYDTETGYKFFNRKKLLPALKKVKDTGWFWDTEIMAQSYYHKLKVLEVPVLSIRRPEKKSTVRIFNDSWDYLVKLIKFKKNLNN